MLAGSFVLLALAQAAVSSPTAPTTVVAPAVTPPKAPRPLQMLFSPMDYPAAALKAREQGIVGVTLDVSAEGRVIGCTISGSSGSATLDSWTCRLLRNRARFAPARDAGGQAVAGQVSDQIVWKLTGRER